MKKDISYGPTARLKLDLYPALELMDWYGFFASSATPAPIVAEWNRQLRDVLGDKEVIAALSELGLDVEISEQEETAARFSSLMSAWTERAALFGSKRDD